ncbi:ScyD/ScyE family protein [Candidatus Leptofilum sp.]|uniref:ScyD/ScyE family protein n=1 Tax=Candidatus Leptofilum sp. TaxID=3241576 RepID=UPI003B5CBE9E
MPIRSHLRMPTPRSYLWIALCLLFIIVACRPAPEPDPVLLTREFANGFLNPVGMAEMPDGGILVAEEGTGEKDLSAGVSLITPDGQVGRLISGLPSGRDSGDLSGVPFVKLSPDGRTLYTAHFNLGALYAVPASGSFTLPDSPLTAENLARRMEPLNNVRLINPFDMTFDANGVPVVSDASGNGVAKETEDGRTQFFHRFASIKVENGSIDPVPTGIERVGPEYFVTLFGGCPYPADSGRLVAIDENRNERVVVDGLNMPIDVARGQDGTVWLLEFARFRPDASCFSGTGYQANSGRLSRVSSNGKTELVLDGLNFPTSVLPRADGSLLISQVFEGNIIELYWGQPEEDTGSESGTSGEVAATRPEFDDLDAVLRVAIEQHGLRPYPGTDLPPDDPNLVALGQQLFFDPLLSGDQNISCATCHHPALALGDGRALPIGTGGEGLGAQREFLEMVNLGAEANGGTVNNPFIGAFVPRNSPTILNSALLPVQFWDGRVDGYAGVVTTQEDEVNQRQLTDALAVQAMFPVTSLHEMAGATLGHLPPEAIRRELMSRLHQIPGYAEQFETLFGTATPDITAVVSAIAAFERQFIMTAAPWDDYLAGDSTALTEQQKRGALLFYGEANTAVNCATCHAGDLFTDLQFHNLLVPQLGPGKGHGPEGRDDWGHAGVSFDARDRFAFRTAPLRNVELTAPYFHSGAYPTLELAIAHHANIQEMAASYDPSQFLPPAFYSSVRPYNAQHQLTTAAPQLINSLPLTQQEIADLVAFLQALTDPAATDLREFVPDAVPSGLPLDPVPTGLTVPPGVANGGGGTAVTDTAPDPTATTQLQFTNVAAQVGLDFQHGAFRTAIFDDPAAMMGAGLCWIDYDQDGWQDLYLVNSFAEDEQDFWQANGGLPSNALFRNQQGQFSDVSAQTGANLALRGNGCIAADFNLDGWPDLYVTADGPNKLLWNQGDGTFVEGASAAGVDAPEWNSAAAVADVNADGWPDLFVAAYIDLGNQIPNPSGAFPQDYYGLPDRMYVNNGDGTFRDVTLDVGLVREERGLGAIFSDLDGNGRFELYIANDGQPNRLYTAVLDDSPAGFHFEDLSLTADIGDSGSGMGVAGGDYDGDGRFDLFVTNWEAELNALYRNEIDERGELGFRYSTYRIGISGLGNNMTGWGTHFADFDQDGDVDLLTVNGRVPVSNFDTDAELVRFYGNMQQEGKPGQFREWTRQVGLHEDGVGPLLARGSAVADYDNDGDLDIAINTVGGTPALLQNNNASGNWLQIELDGFYPGAVVEVALPDGRVLIREWLVGSSYLASEDTRLHVGLGQFDEAARVKVVWQDGVWEETAVAANQHIIVP